ncbi:YccF domain-containing protein [Patulibacter sp. NPDC049589]|uniref:YccF domain-containing protein n=1 Tax=Patulibacter sp. NPDC049589 TaxID=3154731 RepID=UPI00342E5CA6
MRLILNLIWFFLAGFWMALAYTFAALIMVIPIITIPFSIAALRIAGFCLWPFGRTVVPAADAGVMSGIGNVIWLVLAGWWLALGHLITGFVLCLTIIGIPFGIANFKLIPISLLPLGQRVVPIGSAQDAAGVAF